MQTGISIALCTYNGSLVITQTLLSIFNQTGIDYSRFELLIIDNASTDGTADLCRKVIEEHQFSGDYRIIVEPNAGLGNARLRAMREAKLNWLLLCDDDNDLNENYISFGLQLLENNPRIGALGGHGCAIMEGKKPVWFDKYRSSYAVGKQGERSGKLLATNASVYGAGTFINKDALLNAFNGGFSSVMTGRTQQKLSSGEDIEWCYILKLLGYEIWYEEKLQFNHRLKNERLNWEYYLRLKAGIASGSALLHGYHLLLKDKNASVATFIKSYCMMTLKFLLLMVKININAMIEGNVDLAKTIITAKATSYLTNYSASRKQFVAIKKMLATTKYSQ